MPITSQLSHFTEIHSPFIEILVLCRCERERRKSVKNTECFPLRLSCLNIRGKNKGFSFKKTILHVLGPHNFDVSYSSLCIMPNCVCSEVIVLERPWFLLEHSKIHPDLLLSVCVEDCHFVSREKRKEK